MDDTCNANDTPANTTHHPFHWIEGPAQGSLYANYVEAMLDISAGLHTCLQIAYASDLERAANADADPGHSVTPAISVTEADDLKRLAIATTGLLRDDARQRVEWLNALETT